MSETRGIPGGDRCLVVLPVSGLGWSLCPPLCVALCSTTPSGLGVHRPLGCSQLGWSLQPWAALSDGASTSCPRMFPVPGLDSSVPAVPHRTVGALSSQRGSVGLADWAPLRVPSSQGLGFSPSSGPLTPGGPACLPRSCGPRGTSPWVGASCGWRCPLRLRETQKQMCTHRTHLGEISLWISTEGTSPFNSISCSLV